MINSCFLNIWIMGIILFELLLILIMYIIYIILLYFVQFRLWHCSSIFMTELFLSIQRPSINYLGLLLGWSLIILIKARITWGFVICKYIEILSCNPHDYIINYLYRQLYFQFLNLKGSIYIYENLKFLEWTYIVVNLINWYNLFFSK